jgi:hypothetical protein
MFRGLLRVIVIVATHGPCDLAGALVNYSHRHQVVPMVRDKGGGRGQNPLGCSTPLLTSATFLKLLSRSLGLLLGAAKCKTSLVVHPTFSKAVLMVCNAVFALCSVTCQHLPAQASAAVLHVAHGCGQFAVCPLQLLLYCNSRCFCMCMLCYVYFPLKP